MKVAITHDYLIEFGGAERVLLALHEIYPDAPIYTSIIDEKRMGVVWNDFKEFKIITSWFNNLPFASKLISPFRFLLPFIWSGFDLSKYDLIIDSSAWAVTRGFKRNKSQIEICYCHTPPRYLYGYDTSRNWQNHRLRNIIRLYSLIVNRFLRFYDFNSAQKVDYFIANSENVKKRIEKFYRRNSIVIYPPVELLYSQGKKFSNEEYFLTGGRLVAAKNFDLIINACKRAEVNLKIFGTGVLESELKILANGSVEFLGKVPDRELVSLYKNASGFIVAQKDEDFGITTVEAQSVGCPVIAYRGGGYLESVVEDKTGFFFNELNIESITRAINEFKKIKWNKNVIENNAKKFSKERFKKEMLEFVRKVIKNA